MSIENKLTYLNGTKDAIKQAIIGKGVSVTEADTFRSYATKIEEIQGGGTPSKYTGNADAEGLKAIGWTNEDIQYYQENGVNWNEEEDEYHKVPEDNIALYGVLNENNISTYKDLIVYLPKIEITKSNCTRLFENCRAMAAIPMLDTSNVTTMSYMFNNCYSLSTIPMLDTSNVTTMSYMFVNCYLLESIPLFDTSKVRYMTNMFSNCYSLIIVSKLNISKYCNIENMFYNCYSLISVPVLDLTATSNVGNLFNNNYSLSYIQQLSLISFTNQISLINFVSNCYSLRDIEFKDLQVSLNLSYSPFLSKESLLYMIQNAAPTSAIKITLHSNVYNKYIEDPDIVSALESQPNITLAK